MPQGRTFYYRVKRGETLGQIASRYAVSVQDLRRWNGLKKASLRSGQSLRITSDRAPNAGKAKRATGRKGNVKTSGKTAGAAQKPRAHSAKSAGAPGT